MSPYREPAERPVEPESHAYHPRTRLGRLRSWVRGRIVRRRGRWCDRYVRCTVCNAAIPRTAQATEDHMHERHGWEMRASAVFGWLYWASVLAPRWFRVRGAA